MNSAGLNQRAAFFAYQSLWKAVDWVYPPTCAGCGRLGFSWCPACDEELIQIQEPICSKCGLPCTAGALCEQCRKETHSYRALRSCAEYAEPLRSAILRMKDNPDYGLGLRLSHHLVSTFKKQDWKIDLVVPVPINEVHYRKRGYNQTDLFGYPFSLAIHSHYKPKVLSRIRQTRSQVGLTARERMENVTGAFKADASQVREKNVIIVDDVATTGSSISACAAALLEAGAREVFGITLARPFLGNSLQIPDGV